MPAGTNFRIKLKKQKEVIKKGKESGESESKVRLVYIVN
jgi:hypothetical protein